MEVDECYSDLSGKISDLDSKIGDLAGKIDSLQSASACRAKVSMPPIMAMVRALSASGRSRRITASRPRFS